MDVPKDIQHLVGKTSWQHSLDTTDATLADFRRASYASRYKNEVLRIRAMSAAELEKRAAVVVEKAFERLAASHGSMDRAIAVELDSVAMTVRSSWSREDAQRVEAEQFGEVLNEDWGYGDGPIGPTDEREQHIIRQGAELFETREGTFGLVYQKLVGSLLESNSFDRLAYQVGCIAYHSDEIDITSPSGFQAVARAYLTRLTGHQFCGRPADIHEVLGWAMGNRAAAPQPPVFAPPTQITTAYTIQDAFEEWKRRKKIVGPHKTADEFETAINRFAELTGNADISQITFGMVESFAEDVAKLPSRPKAAVKVLPLRDQIAAAAADDLSTLMPPTVGKHVAGVKAALGAAVKSGWISSNAASGVIVDGAKWQGGERDYFSDEDMHRIYTSPLMTDPDACHDTIFWLLLLAPFHGSRPGEHCKLRPHEVLVQDGQWVMRFRKDRQAVVDAAGNKSKREQKTASSVRDVPIHWIVEYAGFTEFAEMQKRRKAEWLFDDLVADQYRDRYKLLSGKINDAIRAVGITEADKSFYSARHTMKREARRRRIVKESVDQSTGHARKTAEKYGDGVPLEILKEDMDQLEFRSVQWDPVVNCALERVARFRSRMSD